MKFFIQKKNIEELQIAWLQLESQKVQNTQMGKLTKCNLKKKLHKTLQNLQKDKNTFNKGQFKNKTSNIIDNLNSDIIKYFKI